jgi:putative addiction module component (TIGR02574 family)
MSNQLDLVEAQALKLSPDERAQLADALLDSLHEGKLAEVEAEWAIEIERRVAAYERGDAKLVPAEDVFAKARLITGS